MRLERANFRCYLDFRGGGKINGEWKSGKVKWFRCDVPYSRFIARNVAANIYGD